MATAPLEYPARIEQLCRHCGARVRLDRCDVTDPPTYANRCGRCGGRCVSDYVDPDVWPADRPTPWQCTEVRVQDRREGVLYGLWVGGRWFADYTDRRYADEDAAKIEQVTKLAFEAGRELQREHPKMRFETEVTSDG